MAKFCLSLMLLLALAAPCAADEQMINMPDASEEPLWQLAPGVLLELPDGSRTIISEKLPDGGFLTREGLLILPDGRISQDETAQKARIIRPVPERGEEHAASAEVQTPMSPGSAMPGILDETETGHAAPGAATDTGEASKSIPQASAAPAAPRQEEGGSADVMPVTIAGLLPMTPITATEKQEKMPEKTLPVNAKGPGAMEKNADAKKAAEKPASKEKAKIRQERKTAPDEKKSGEATQKARPGEHLRIPPGAVASGKLDFLEGCWQGTRPEYYSKRSIRECFCFDGKGSGKRRIIDAAGGGRMCIGPARASLSSAGVLSVTSGRSPCTDGERWGQAEMVCRGEGSRTPCSWVFRDAKGGRQSYEIPLVRVESCGR